MIKETLKKLKQQGYTYEEMDIVLKGLMEEIADSNELREEMTYRVRREGEYTVEDYHKLPDDPRVELMDGRFYVMEAPSYLHQKIAGEIYRQIANFIVEQGGNCEPMIAPVDVQLDCDEKTMVQPDIAILCDRDKVRKWGGMEHRILCWRLFRLHREKRIVPKKLQNMQMQVYENIGS